MSDPTLHVACPDCGASNRLPEARLGEAPKCGKCGAPLFSAHPSTLTDANFDKLVNGTDLPVVVDCWASWCGPCMRFAPVFEEAAAKLEPRVRLAKLDTDANQTVSARLGIRSIPTLVMFKGGKEVARVSGALPLGPFLEWVKQNAA
ncbi:MAG TPA: thioredoxin TrxC [Gammaproteobacteria bacterium]|jgi:thioredoxin 2|nr:thioredoxin TrxC [Gammaproteobacteria bacterium]